MILHRIFQKSSEDPQVRGRAYRGCDLSNITTRFLLKIFGRSQREFLEILEWSWIKIMLSTSADLKKISNEDLFEIFFRNLIEISWRFIWRSWEDLPTICKKLMKFFFKLKFEKNLGRFLMKILQRSQKDFYWRSQ